MVSGSAVDHAAPFQLANHGGGAPPLLEAATPRVLEILSCWLQKHGLPAVDMAVMDESQDDPSLSREGRSYKMWVSSIASLIPGQAPVQDLVGDLHDGELLLRIIEVLGAEEGIKLSKKRMNVNPRSRYHKLENVNYVVELCQEKLNLQLTNVGGLDILDGNVKILYAVLYKLMRYHSMSIIRKVSGDKGVDEESVVAWTNKRIAENDGSSAITSFRDQSLKTSIFFMDLLEAMKPGVVDWDLLRGVEKEEDLMHNAKYVISVARKIGAQSHYLGRHRRGQ